MINYIFKMFNIIDEIFEEVVVNLKFYVRIVLYFYLDRLDLSKKSVVEVLFE